MDPSPLIFVALAIAWGAYLIPKALEHHDAGSRSRTISTFSERLRILARREAVSRRRSTLVTSNASDTSAPEQDATPSAPVRVVDQPRVEVFVETMSESILETTQSGRLHLPSELPGARHSGASGISASSAAARRRRRVLGVLVFLFAATAAVAAGHVISWFWLIAPATLILGWLITCRRMVTGERARRSGTAVVPHPRLQAQSEAIVDQEVTAFAEDDTSTVPIVTAELVEGAPAEAASTWEPVQAPLPTYVSKDAAPRRAVTIDLDSTGVWTSGRSEVDSAIAREAEADAARAKVEQAPIKRASGA